MAGFAASLRTSIDKTLLNVNDQCMNITEELFTMVVELTPSPTMPGPYAKGLLANQWYPGQRGEFSDAVGTDTSDNGSASIERIRGLDGFSFLGQDTSLTLTNNLEYAYQAEAIGWLAPKWSGRRPYGYHMVELSLQAISSKYK